RGITRRTRAGREALGATVVPGEVLTRLDDSCACLAFHALGRVGDTGGRGGIGICGAETAGERATTHSVCDHAFRNALGFRGDELGQGLREIGLALLLFAGWIGGGRKLCCHPSGREAYTRE